MIFGTAATTAAQNSDERTANHFAVFVPQPFRAIDKLAVGGISRSARSAHLYNLNFVSIVCGLRRGENRR